MSEKEKTWTILEILNWSKDFFEKKGIETPLLDAQILLAYALDKSRVQLYTDFDKPLNPEERTKFKELVIRRSKREPIAYIVQTKGFWKHQFKVNPHVLIPRADTECLIETILDLQKNPPKKILDIGTGSGCLAISLKKEFPDCHVTATDISKEALLVAFENAKANQVSIEFKHTNIADGIEGSFDIIVSNPPYIPQDELDATCSDVKDYEPHLALLSSENGMYHYNKILDQTVDLLAEDGLMVLEIGDQRENDLSDLAKKYFYHTTIGRDLKGLARVLTLKSKKEETTCKS